MKFEITKNNTEISKLWNLAKNGLFDRRTINKIIENSTDDKIVFSSKNSYEKYLKLQYSTSALYNY